MREAPTGSTEMNLVHLKAFKKRALKWGSVGAVPIPFLFQLDFGDI